MDNFTSNSADRRQKITSHKKMPTSMVVLTWLNGELPMQVNTLSGLKSSFGLQVY